MWSSFHVTIRRSTRLPVSIRAFSTGKSYTNIIVSRPQPNVALFTLNRPKALNALNSELMTELNEAMEAADKDVEIGAMVLTGSERAFAGEDYVLSPHPLESRGLMFVPTRSGS